MRDLFREAGYLKARRGQQFSGSPESPDVIVPELPLFHIEVKRVQRGNPYDWMAQAAADAGLKIPVVFHKRNNSGWLVIMRSEEWFGLVSGSDLPLTGNGE